MGEGVQGVPSSLSPSPMLARLRPRCLRLYSTAPPPPKGLLGNERQIHQKLTERFAPTTLQVQDVSGASSLLFTVHTRSCSPLQGGCGDFYAIVIASNEFKGLSTIKQHKLVNSTLAEEIKNIHGLQVTSFVHLFAVLT